MATKNIDYIDTDNLWTLKKIN
jgi:hypothetical protein